MTAPLMPLVSSLRRRRMVAGKAAFSPLSISGCVAWYDASDLGSITESSGAVSQWNDLSGNGYHLTQGTGSLQPTTGTRTINGLNVLDFASDALRNTSFGALSNWTVFAIASADVAANWSTVWSSNGGDFEVGFHGGPTFLWWSTSSAAGGVYSTATPYLFEGLHTNGGTDTLYVNGSSVISATRTANIGTNFSVGSYHGGGDHLDGIVAEIVVYNSVLGSTDRATVRDYLNAKWAVYA